MKTKNLHVAIIILSLLVMGTQPAQGTKYIRDDATGGDATSIGNWDWPTKTCTLTTDVAETIQIDSDGITLDGAEHMVTGPGTAGTDYGVYLSERTGVTLKNLIIKGFANGIHLYYSNGNTLTDNTTSNNVVGIYLRNSIDNTLTENTTHSNIAFGIALIYSNNNTVTGNTASNSLSDWGHGIYLQYSSNNTVTDNTAESNCYVGIYLHHDCSNNTVSGNTSNSNIAGIALENSSNNTVTENTVNSNTGNGISLYASNDSTVTDNVVSHSTQGISLNNAHENLVTGNTTTNNSNGIRLNWYCSNNTVSDNTSNSNSNYGIVMSPYCRNNTVTGNTATDNPTGIGLWASSDNQISGNNLSGNAIALSASGPEHRGNRYVNNDLSNSTSWSVSIAYDSSFELSGNDFTNSANGIALGNMDGASLSNVDLSTINGGTGLQLTGVTNSSFSNILVSGGEYGMLVWQESNGNTFHDNTISNNTHGMFLIYNSSSNTIYNNNFINNTTQAHVAGDCGSVFNLDKPTGGNYWSDWISPDDDGDGFVDNPYVFGGGQDNLPWAEPDGWLCKDTEEMIVELANQMLSLDLQDGISNSLEAKLAAALQALEDDNQNNDIAAINSLEAFINAVQAQRGKKIPVDEANALIARAQRIKDCMNGS